MYFNGVQRLGALKRETAQSISKLEMMIQSNLYGNVQQSILDGLSLANLSECKMTDSAIISLDGWYRYVLRFCDGIPMTIKNQVCEVDKVIDGEPEYAKVSTEKITDYDFINDEIVENDRLIDPMIITTQDGLKFSIINLISYMIGIFVNDYMNRYCTNSNSESNGDCMITMKNEFLKNRAA